MRITNNMQTQNIINKMMTNQSKVAGLQTQLASGNKYNYISDNPSIVPSIMSSEKMLNKIDIYENNIEFLKGESNVTDTTLSQMINIFQRLNSLTIEAANGTNGAEQLELINNEVNQIKEQLVSLGNTSYNNQYIFSGNKTGTVPFKIEDDGSVSYNGTPADGDYKRSYTIADSVELSINIPGDRILGWSKPIVDADGNMTGEYEGQGIMLVLNNLTAALSSGEADHAAIRAQLDPLNEALNEVLAAETEIGGYQNRLSMTQEQHENSKITYDTLKTNLQSVDISELVTKLSAQQVSLQASLYAGSQIMSISLLDYL